MRSHASSRRPGFTLIELLVVIVIILVLASFVVAFAPRLAERQKVSRGASLLQQWLATARSRAGRDRVPTGVRLQVDPNTHLVTQLQFIQKPDDFTGGQVRYTPPPPGLPTVIGTGVDFTGGFGSPDLYPVQIGDWVELKGGGLVHQIGAVSPNQLTLITMPPPSNAILPTSEYRVLRAPRVLPGEPALDMPKDVAIDVTNTTGMNLVTSRILTTTSGTWTTPDSSALLPSVSNTIDILFSPSGELVGTGAGQVGVVLLVRDTSLDPTGDGSYAGEPVLIAVYSKTGFIAAHPVNIGGATPDFYKFVKDGHSSGL